MTEGAIYETVVLKGRVACQVILPFELHLSEDEATLLEANIHNAMELVLAPYFNLLYKCRERKQPDVEDFV